MAGLPDELWIQILDYVEPETLLKCQRVSRRMLKLARDSSLWRSKCFERAPSAVHAFSSGNSDSLSDLLNGLSLAGSRSYVHDRNGNGQYPVPINRRAKAIVKWDCTNATEHIDWLSEFVARHAPLSTEWLHHAKDNEIRSMALFGQDDKVLSAMEDGSLRIWDVKTSGSGRRRLKESGRSAGSLMFDDLSSTSGPSASRGQPNVGAAVDSTVVDDNRKMAYVAVGNILNEVDLGTMQLVSQNKYAWSITALSQLANPELPLMVGTSFSLQMHDPRLSLRYQADQTDHRLDMTKEDENLVFLENYNKAEHRSKWTDGSKGSSSHPRPSSASSARSRSPAPRLEACARVEPGPQAILHHGINEIIVAGRMPSILFYDKRKFPQLQYSIHSGARLSSITTLPYSPRASTSAKGQATLIAAGEYHGRGSLELYELPHRQAHKRRSSHNQSSDSNTDVEGESGSSGTDDTQHSGNVSGDPGIEDTDTTLNESGHPFSYRNRQSASQAKILSVAIQGARIVYSDGEGGLRWMERDGRGLARRWNINSYEYTHGGGAVIGEAVARKILTFSADANKFSGRHTVSCGDGDLLVWTGSDIGIVTNKVKWTDHDELVKAFEEKMHLDDTPRKNQEQEEAYSRTMRLALERQADERRFLARFGRTGGW